MNDPAHKDRIDGLKAIRDQAKADADAAAAKAQRADCLNAHAGHGLFAPLFIAADLLRDKGCKF